MYSDIQQQLAKTRQDDLYRIAAEQRRARAAVESARCRKAEAKAAEAAPVRAGHGGRGRGGPERRGGAAHQWWFRRPRRAPVAGDC
jgi:hypothetical protein